MQRATRGGGRPRRRHPGVDGGALLAWRRPTVAVLGAALAVTLVVGCSQSGGLEDGGQYSLTVTRGEHARVSSVFSGCGTVVEMLGGAEVTRLGTVRNSGIGPVTIEAVGGFPVVQPGDPELVAAEPCRLVIRNVEVAVDATGARGRGAMVGRDASQPFEGGLLLPGGATAYLWIDQEFVDDRQRCDFDFMQPAPLWVDGVSAGREVSVSLDGEPLALVPRLDAFLQQYHTVERFPDPQRAEAAP